jgi:hypothetical protein
MFTVYTFDLFEISFFFFEDQTARHLFPRGCQALESEKERLKSKEKRRRKYKKTTQLN